MNCAEMDGAVALVEELEIGHSIAGFGNVVLDGGFVVRARLGDDDDVVETDVGEVAAIFVGENGRRDAVAGMEFRGDDRILELVGHRHRIHKAGDGFAVESDVSGVGADDLAAYLKGDLRGGGTGCRRSGADRRQPERRATKRTTNKAFRGTAETPLLMIMEGAWWGFAWLNG